MERATPNWLLALNLLVIVALVAALVTVLDGRPEPGVAIEGLAQSDEEAGVSGAGPTDVDLEADPTLGDAEIHWVNASALQGDGAAMAHSSGTNCAYSTNSNWVQAQIDLPNGAEILAAIAYYRDNTATSGQGVEAWIYRHDTINGSGATSPTQDLLYSFNSDGSSATAAPNYASSAMDFEGAGDDNIIDLTTWTYNLYVRTDGNTSNNQFCGLQILWAPENDEGLVFYPVEPCAVFDTRASQGGRGTPLAAGETITFDTVLSNYDGQGGVTGDCGIPDEAGGGFLGGSTGTQAVMINVVALNPAGPGNFKVWNDDDTEPDGGALVFKEGTNTNTVLPMGISRDVTFGADGGKINIKNNALTTTDVRVVVVGYFDQVEMNQT